MVSETLFERRNGISPQRRLLAARQIADTEADLGRAHAREDAPKLSGWHNRRAPMAHVAMRAAFYEVTEGQGLKPEDALASLELFTEYPELENATLARVNMHGDWDAAKGVERQLVSMVSELWDRGYHSLQLLNRNAPDPKRSSFIHTGFTPEFGLIALRRKRRLIIADSTDPDMARSHLEIDKVSTFALDIDMFDQLGKQAANEVRLIAASAVYQLIDQRVFLADQSLEDFSDPMDYLPYLSQLKESMHLTDTEIQRALELATELKRILSKYKMSYDDVIHRCYNVDHPNSLQNEAGLQFIEEAINMRSGLLTPASTTYYAHS